jgi:hypothetical protein
VKSKCRIKGYTGVSMIGPQQVNMGFLLNKINCIIVQQKSSPGRIFFIRNLNKKKNIRVWGVGPF